MKNENSSVAEEKKLIVRFTVDVKAALLAGHVIGKTVDIEIGPDDLGDRWQELVARLDVSTQPVMCPANLTTEKISGQEISDVIALLDRVKAAADATAARDAEHEAKLEAAIAEFTRLVEAWDPETCLYETENRSIFMSEDGTIGLWDVNILQSPISEMELPNSQAPIYPEGMPCSPWLGAYGFDARVDAADEVWKSKRKTFESRISVEIAEILQAHMPELRKLADAKLAEMEAEKQAKKAAKYAKFAKRLESGEVIIEFPSYNPRRHGKPWGATVELVNGKLVYSFVDNYTGGWGEAGELTIPCKPGDVIAEGQKDTRRPDRSYHQLRLMREDGGMDNLTKTEAVHALKA